MGKGEMRVAYGGYSEMGFEEDALKGRSPRTPAYDVSVGGVYVVDITPDPGEDELLEFFDGE